MRSTRALLLFGLLAAFGCDDPGAGQLAEVPGPPRLTHLMVQSQKHRSCVRCTAIDLLDVHDPTSRSCNDSNPCVPQFTLRHSDPASSLCQVPAGSTDGSGFCPDPLLARPVSVYAASE